MCIFLPAEERFQNHKQDFPQKTAPVQAFARLPHSSTKAWHHRAAGPFLSQSCQPDLPSALPAHPQYNLPIFTLVQVSCRSFSQ